MTPKIVCRNVYKCFGPNSAEAIRMARDGQSQSEILKQTKSVLALNDISLEIGAGETFVIMGLSGSGKSTLIRHFNRLVDPTTGQVIVDDTDITTMDRKELRTFRRHKISMVFQNFGLLPHRTVLKLSLIHI